MLSNSPSLPTAFFFAGQGSQYYHMAADLMHAEPVFRQWMEIGDRIVRSAQGFSPLETIYSAQRSKTEPFDHLEHSHPALFMTQFAAAKLLQDRGVRPDLLIGVSLGEFVAMSVAGMLPFETALRAIARQPSVFRKSTPPGALIAMLGPETLLQDSHVLRDTAVIAGVNAESHCVIACLETDSERVTSELRRLDVAFQKLPVPFAFHSHFVETARDDYLATVAGLAFETPFWPVWSACLAAPLDTVDGGLLWRIVREPMRLRSTLAAIEAKGGAHYIDLSPTGTLAAVLRQKLTAPSPSKVSPLMSPFGGDLKRLEKLVEAGV
ncbi:acyltransferase domain-containing protein [Roseibium aggregatum]|uniref:Acyltransferase domain-containing protein n=1 Tax=Roseibium aggregatum TaxID=187304 RepID=A0A939EDH3_9HYPH|nr:acyltransferase domain-containing protein [Roseibium aggregatum]MBN9669594.1 acyltransferase domain-containing protein [Roseibium aggregatum]